jgi:hypothetical protein
MDASQIFPEDTTTSLTLHAQVEPESHDSDQALLDELYNELGDLLFSDRY